MNKAVQDIAERFQIEPEAALRIYSAMEVNFSECTQEEFDAEALRVYEAICRQEMSRT